MNFIPTKITGIGTDDIFGTDGAHGYPFNGSILAETVLRYIALKKNNGSIESLSPITVREGYVYYSSNFTDGDIFLPENNDENIFIVKQDSSYSGGLPTFKMDGFESTEGWRIPVATILTAKTKIETAIYVNKETKKVVIFVRKVTSSWTELLCSLMFLLVPWLYKEDFSDYDETEKEFFRAINKGDGDTFTRLVNELCAPIDFEALKVRQELKDWFNLGKESEIERLKNLISSKRSDIRAYEESLSYLYNEVANSLTQINSLTTTSSKDPDEFYNLFKSRGLTFIRKDKGGSGTQRSYYIDYSVVDTLEFYDKDEFMRTYNSKASYMYQNVTEETRKVFYAIFIEEKGKFRTEATFRLQGTSGLRAISGSLSGYYTDQVLPHPHLYYHACLGANGDYIRQYLESGDIDMALDQTIAAVKNINFGDPIVCGGIMQKLTSQFWNKKCIIADNGEDMTPAEFLKYITPKENQGEKKE